MKKYCLLLVLLLMTQSCSFAATPTPTKIPTPIPTPTLIPPTPVGYGVDFPYDAPEEWREGNKISGTLDPDVVKRLVASGGKLDQSDNGNVIYLWTGNVPLELFIEPKEDFPFGTYYDYWGTSYNVYAQDGSGVTYITVIEKVMPQQ